VLSINTDVAEAELSPSPHPFSSRLLVFIKRHVPVHNGNSGVDGPSKELLLYGFVNFQAVRSIKNVAGKGSLITTYGPSAPGPFFCPRPTPSLIACICLSHALFRPLVMVFVNFWMDHFFAFLGAWTTSGDEPHPHVA
jgi:hypothetical protein